MASGQLSVASRQLPGTAGSGYELVARRGMGACSPILDGTTVGPIPGLMRVGISREGTTEWPGHLAAASKETAFPDGSADLQGGFHLKGRCICVT